MEQEQTELLVCKPILSIGYHPLGEIDNTSAARVRTTTLTKGDAKAETRTTPRSAGIWQDRQGNMDTYGLPIFLWGSAKSKPTLSGLVRDLPDPTGGWM
jgi:hypothetical protein